MANFSITDPQVVDSLNYVLSGPSSIGNDFEGLSQSEFVYLTNETNGSLALTDFTTNPYVIPYVEGDPPPVGYPAPYDTYIKTGMYVPIAISDPTQQVNVTAQVRPWFSWTLSTPSEIRWRTSLNRYKVPNLSYDPALALDNFYQPTTVLVSVPIKITKVASDPFPLEGETVTNGSTGMVYTNVVDIPGSIGIFYYWMEFNITLLSGDMVIDWTGTDIASISASLIKR